MSSSSSCLKENSETAEVRCPRFYLYRRRIPTLPTQHGGLCPVGLTDRTNPPARVAHGSKVIPWGELTRGVGRTGANSRLSRGENRLNY